MAKIEFGSGFNSLLFDALTNANGFLKMLRAIGPGFFA